ncbi:MAG: HD domain-containing protein [Actinobacteria bacterium]|nr:HD domain-containing protein [Actinomycetota bacterium]MCA1806295.1 HD domain-containing protein [Actinomycetota bacterium]
MDAKAFASRKHKDQYRRDGSPYIDHPNRVAQHVKRVKGTSTNIDDIEAAAWLHDTLEDTETSYEEIEAEYGPMVASMVAELTSDKEEIAREGKTKYLQQKLGRMSNYALIVKLADRLDNVSDLATADPQWADKYAQQTQDILEYLVDNRELTPTQLRLVAEINELI